MASSTSGGTPAFTACGSEGTGEPGDLPFYQSPPTPPGFGHITIPGASYFPAPLIDDESPRCDELQTGEEQGNPFAGTQGSGGEEGENSMQSLDWALFQATIQCNPTSRPGPLMPPVGHNDGLELTSTNQAWSQDDEPFPYRLLGRHNYHPNTFLSTQSSSYSLDQPATVVVDPALLSQPPPAVPRGPAPSRRLASGTRRKKDPVVSCVCRTALRRVSDLKRHQETACRFCKPGPMLKCEEEGCRFKDRRLDKVQEHCKRKRHQCPRR